MTGADEQVKEREITPRDVSEKDVRSFTTPEIPGSDVRSFSVSTTIQQLVQQLGSVGRNNNLRAEIIAESSERSYEVSVVIDRIVSSLGTVSLGEADTNGKTVTGKISGTEQAIEVAATEDSSEELEGFRRGDTWTAEVKVLAWDSLYSRLRSVQV